MAFIDVFFKFQVSVTPEKQSWFRPVSLQSGVTEVANTEEWAKAHLPIPDSRISMALLRHRMSYLSGKFSCGSGYWRACKVDWM